MTWPTPPIAAQIYTVQPGDTPMLIAQRFTANPYRLAELIAANPGKDQVLIQGVRTFASLYPGERLYLPLSWVHSTVGVGRGGGGGGGSHGGGGGGGHAGGGGSFSSAGFAPGHKGPSGGGHGQSKGPSPGPGGGGGFQQAGSPPWGGSPPPSPGAHGGAPHHVGGGGGAPGPGPHGGGGHGGGAGGGGGHPPPSGHGHGGPGHGGHGHGGSRHNLVGGGWGWWGWGWDGWNGWWPVAYAVVASCAWTPLGEITSGSQPPSDWPADVAQQALALARSNQTSTVYYQSSLGYFRLAASGGTCQVSVCAFYGSVTGVGQASSGGPDPGSNTYTPPTITTASAGQTQLNAVGTTTDGVPEPGSGDLQVPGSYTAQGVTVQQGGGQVPVVPPAPPTAPTTDPVLLALGVGATLIGVGGFAYLVHMRQKKGPKRGAKR